MIAIPVFPEAVDGPVRVCAIVAREHEAARLVRVRTTAEGDVFLGALVDRDGNCREWLELWVQAEPASEAPAGHARRHTANAPADASWKRQAAWLALVDGDRRIGGPWERQHPPPLFLDPESGRATVPGEGDEGGPWALCRDDATLEAAGLGPYADSDRRFLWRPGMGAGSGLLSAQAGTGPDGLVSWAEVLEQHGRLVALNPGCGLMIVRRLAPVGFEAYVRWLTDGRLSSPPAQRVRELLGEDDGGGPEDDRADSGGLVTTVGGTTGHLVEVLYLKLRAIASAIEAVRDAVRALDRPVLTLTPACLSVELAEPSAGLPYAWTARVLLDDPGGAQELERTRGHPRRFVAPAGAGLSVYRPRSSAGAVSTTGRVRVKRVTHPSDASVVLEGAVWSGEPLRPDASTVAIITLGVGADRHVLHAHLQPDSALGPGELAFVSMPLPAGTPRAEGLAATEGVEFDETPISLLPAMSSPADLYSLGVLALRTLIAGEGEGVGEAVDAALTLARDLGSAGNPQQPVGARVESIVEGDERWLERLGPHRLVSDGLSYDGATGAIPAELWWGLIGTLARFFPGMGPDSFCGSLGLPAEARLPTAFDEPLAQLREHIRRVRGLLCVDWRTCEEVGAVIDRQLGRLAPADGSHAAPGAGAGRPG